MKQPQFDQIFYECFGPRPRKVRYRLRSDGNFGSDQVFLGSLIHDARFLRQEVSLRGDKLLLKLERDCWERGLTPTGDGAVELHNSVAVLRMSPVEEVLWSIPQGRIDSNEELWIYSIFRVRKPLALSGNTDSFILDGHTWHATINLKECDEPLVELEDKTVPALWSDISDNPKLLAKFRSKEV